MPTNAKNTQVVVQTLTQKIVPAKLTQVVVQTLSKKAGSSRLPLMGVQ